MSASAAQKRLSETITWLEGHVQKTDDTVAQCQGILDSVDAGAIAVDTRLKIGRTLSELLERSQEAKDIVTALQRYRDNVGETRELIAEMKTLIEGGEG